MSQTRIHKFERMLRYQTNQVDLLRQQLAAQNAVIHTLDEELHRLKDGFDRLHQASFNAQATLAMHEQCGRAMIEGQKKIKAKQIELASAKEKLDYLLESFREENKRLKAWEKLVERESLREQAELLNQEIQQADELYLLTKLSGDDR